MTRAAAAAASLAVLAAVTGVARAGNELTGGDESLSLPRRTERHLGRAGEAAAAGDGERAAGELVNTCASIIYTADPRSLEVCGRAQQAVAPYPHLASRLSAVGSCAAAWTLDWPRARALAAAALALGADGPPADTLAGEGLRGARLCLGAVAIEEGKYDEASRELDRFVSQSEAAGDRDFLAAGLTWQCRLAVAMGDYPRARALCRRAEEVAAGDVARLPAALWQRGNVERVDVGAEIAAPIWQRGLDAAIAMGSPQITSALRVDLADAYVELGRLDDAGRLIDAHLADVAARRVPDTYARQLAAMRGALLAARGDHAGAIAQFDLGVTSPMYGAVLYALDHRAASLVALGRLAEARASLEAAVAHIEAARARTPGEEGRRSYLDRHAEVFRGLAALELAVGGPDAAARTLAAAEAGRARALLDAVRAAQRDAATPAAPRRYTPAEIQAALPPGHTLLVYVTEVEHTLAIRVTREAMSAALLPGAGPRAALGERVRYFRDLVAEVDEPAALDAAGAALYRDLLAPLFPQPPTGTLVIAADGPLHALPFDALRVDGRFLVERADIVLTPSGAVLGAGAVHPPVAAPVLAVGAPVLPPHLPPLRAADDELRAVAASLRVPPRTLVGAGATEAAVRDGLGRYRVLHFATHAVLDDARPGRSGLMLTAAGGDDGRLRADEIYGARMAGELVVLSACRTGDGTASSSEGPLSLARAFLHAGAGAVVATLWDVDDHIGPAFMGELYRRFADGRAVSVAMAETKRAMIGRQAPPRTWAGYVAIGRPAATPALPGAVPPPPWRRAAATALAAAGLLAIVAGGALRRREPRGRATPP